MIYVDIFLNEAVSAKLGRYVQLGVTSVKDKDNYYYQLRYLLIENSSTRKLKTRYSDSQTDELIENLVAELK